MTNSRTHLTEFRTTRRYLPHWQEPGRDYFVTWATYSRKELAADERTIALNAVRFWDGKRWEIYTAVVMPENVHILCRPLWIPKSSPRACYTLESIVHSVKSFSAHEINKVRHVEGSAVWQSERQDRMLRNDTEFWQKWEYIRNNPVAAELADSAEDYPWFFQHTGLEPPHSTAMEEADE